MKLILSLILLACGAVSAAPGDVLSCNILANGREADITFSGLGTGGTYLTGLGTNNALTGAERCKFTVVSHSWTAAGVATTITRNVYGQWPRRKPYPDNATNEETFAGGNTTVRMVLNDYIYAEDKTGAGNSGTDVTLTTLAGLYTKTAVPSNAVTGLTCTNNSTAVFQQTGLWWTMAARTRVTDTFTISAAAFSRHYGRFKPVRCVKFEVSDQHGHTETYYDEELYIDSTQGDQKPIQEYSMDVPVTAFTEGDVLTCNATAYPWVGDNTATTVAGASEPSSALGPVTFYLDKNNDYGVTVALVDSADGADPGAADATKVYDSASYNPATAYKFATIGRAFASIKAYNLANRGRNDVSAGIVYANAGTYTWLGSTNTLGGAVDVRPTFAAAAGVAASAVTISAASSGSNDLLANNITLQGVSITSAGANTFDDSTDILLKDCILNTSNTALFGEAGQSLTMDGGSAPLFGQGFKGGAAVNSSWRLLRGVDLSSFGGQLLIYCVVGCRGTGMTAARFVDEATGQASPTTLPLLAYNEFLGIVNSGGADVMQFGSLSNNSQGCFIINNVVETITGTGAGGMMTLYTGDRDYKNSVMAYNTFVGARSFRHYNDGQTGGTEGNNYLREFGTSWFEYFDRDAHKWDLLSPQNGGRQGTIITLGVGVWGTYRAQNMWSLPGSFYAEFPGIGSYQPGTGTNGTAAEALQMFHRRASALPNGTSDPITGTGGGDYRPLPTSPLVPVAQRSGMPELLPYDLAGNPRENNDACGAYTLNQSTNRAKTRARRSSGF